jgi:hypothetical protein
MQSCVRIDGIMAINYGLDRVHTARAGAGERIRAHRARHRTS